MHSTKLVQATPFHVRPRNRCHLLSTCAVRCSRVTFKQYGIGNLEHAAPRADGQWSNRVICPAAAAAYSLPAAPWPAPLQHSTLNPTPAFYSPYGFRMIWLKGPKIPCDLRKRARVARMICTGGLTETRTTVLKNSQKSAKSGTISQNPSGSPGHWQIPL
jgi:hypothetical protein